jgi:hypothetical protein
MALFSYISLPQIDDAGVIQYIRVSLDDYFQNSASVLDLSLLNISEVNK